jgi:YHS domain-containing protein
MIKNVAFILVLTGLVACGNGVNQEDMPNVETSNATDHKIAAADADPICKMGKEASWTDYAVKASGDTVWFCSPTCKDAYTANK